MTHDSGAGRSNRQVRRKILVHLYEVYSTDPHAVVSPHELEIGAEVTRDQIMGNIFYLEERRYVECMKRYGSKLFAAVRITPEGIDLVEDVHRLNAVFGRDRPRPAGGVDSELSADIAETFRQLHLLAYDHGFDTDQRNAVLDDLRALQFEIGRPPDRRRLDKIQLLVELIDEALAPTDGADREIDLLRGILRSWMDTAE